MPDLNRPSLDSAFHTIQERLTHLLNYATVVAPAVSEQREQLAELRDSVVVLLAARLDAFFHTVVSLGTRHKEASLRTLLKAEGHEKADTCDLPTLVTLVRARVSLKKDGRRLDNLFLFLFNCSVWPNDEVKELVLDLVLLRNIIIHSAGSDWSQDGVHPAKYATQFRRADVLNENRYGDLATYAVDSAKVMLFVRTVILAILEQLKYLEQRLVKDMSWADPN